VITHADKNVRVTDQFQPGSYGKYAQFFPTPADAVIPVTGDLSISAGVWVRQILAHPEKSKAKYTMASFETLSFGEMLKIWSEVTGRQSVYIQATRQDYENLFWHAGKDLALQLEFGEVVTDWLAGKDVATPADLDIKEEEVPGFRQTMETFKDLI
jgi:isopenicillin N synthase-like dioxygenase